MQKSYIFAGPDRPGRAENLKKALLSLEDVLFVDISPETRRVTVLLTDTCADEQPLFEAADGIGCSLFSASPRAEYAAAEKELGGGALFRTASAICSIAAASASALSVVLQKTGAARSAGAGDAAFFSLFRAFLLLSLILLHFPALFEGVCDVFKKEYGADALTAFAVFCGALRGVSEGLFYLYDGRTPSVGGFAAAAAVIALGDLLKLLYLRRIARAGGSCATFFDGAGDIGQEKTGAISAAGKGRETGADSEEIDGGKAGAEAVDGGKAGADSVKIDGDKAGAGGALSRRRAKKSAFPLLDTASGCSAFPTAENAFLPVNAAAFCSSALSLYAARDLRLALRAGTGAALVLTLCVFGFRILTELSAGAKRRTPRAKQRGKKV